MTFFSHFSTLFRPVWKCRQNRLAPSSPSVRHCTRIISTRNSHTHKHNSFTRKQHKVVHTCLIIVHHNEEIPKKSLHRTKSRTQSHECIHTLKNIPKHHTLAQHTFIQTCISILPNKRKFQRFL